MIIHLLMLATQTGAPTPAFHAYANCLVTESVRLIPSGEPAETIVTAAEPTCELLMEGVVNEHAQSMASDPILAKHGSRFGFDAMKDAREAAPRYRQAAHGIALREVVRAKAKIGKAKN